MARDKTRVGTGKSRNTLEALRRRVAPDENGCWTWPGVPDSGGYGQVGWQGAKRQAHIVFYEQIVGPIPQGTTLDHLCRNRACVNPAHLEPVTNRDNIMRGIVPSANRQVCKAGIHDITAPGSVATDSEGVERCRECRRESKRRYALRQHAA